MRVLIVEDDEILAQTLSHHLADQQYVVDVATDGASGWNYTQSITYDLLILDIDLPRLSGIELCQRLRSHQHHEPILLLTARSAYNDKVQGLDAGADDYVIKPYNADELLARVRALLRRQRNGSGTGDSLLTWGCVSLNPISCQVSVNGDAIAFSPKEYQLVELLLRHPQQVLSSEQILDHVWTFDETPGKDTVRTHIRRLRKKLKAAGAEDWIETVYGLGYRLKALKPPLTNSSELTVSADSADFSAPPSSAPALSPDLAREKTQALWPKFKPRILENIADVEAAIAALQTQTLEDSSYEQATRTIHKLIGSLGMFGFSQGSELARQMEVLWQWVATISSGSPSQFFLDQRTHVVTTQLAQMVHQLKCTIDPKDTDIFNLSLQENQAVESLSSLSINVTGLSNAHILAIGPENPLILALKPLLRTKGGLLQTLEDCLLHDSLGRIQTLSKILATSSPNLLLLDGDHEQSTRFLLCQTLRHHPQWKYLPIVIMTAHPDPCQMYQFFAAGADDYVLTYLPASIIFSRLERHLEKYALLHKGLSKSG